MSKNMKLSKNINFVFWGVLLEIFSLGLFEFGPISSSDITRIIGIILVSIGSYNLISENINFKKTFIANLFVIIAEIATLVIAFMGISADLEAELSEHLFSDNITAIPVETLYYGLIDAIVSIATNIAEVITVIFIALGMMNINKGFGKPNLTRYGDKRYRGIRNFGIINIIGGVLSVLSSLIILNNYNKLVDGIITEETLMSNYALFGFAGLVSAVGAIGYFIQIIKLLIYMNRTKVATQYYTVNNDYRDHNQNIGGLRDEDIVDVKVENVRYDDQNNNHDKWDDEIK